MEVQEVVKGFLSLGQFLKHLPHKDLFDVPEC